ncbi:MAG: nickel pincer cofactor biosynthesis protein LarB [Nitrospirae bacterium]|nr:nickel pincer cofactor biosynthesis protein LarB [Nitrospirota bacterium]
MIEPRLRSLLTAVQQGRLPLEQALDKLRHLPYENLGYARLDHHRPLRQGLPEVIFCEGKEPEHVAQILRRMQGRGAPVLATRVSPALAAYLRRRHAGLVYHRLGRVAVLPADGDTARASSRRIPNTPLVLIVTAGTADLPVAEEARITAETFGHRVDTLYDVGVAGLHRLTAHVRALQLADVLIVIAGMEGALPSIVGGLTGRPVIAVPTSRGYGAHFGGLAPLLTMLTSCAPGLAVVNIDNGFGAAALAHRILMPRLQHAQKPEPRPRRRTVKRPAQRRRT